MYQTPGRDTAPAVHAVAAAAKRNVIARNRGTNVDPFSYGKTTQEIIGDSNFCFAKKTDRTDSVVRCAGTTEITAESPAYPGRFRSIQVAVIGNLPIVVYELLLGLTFECAAAM